MKETVVEQRLKTKVERIGGLCLKWGSGWPGAMDRIIFLGDGIVHFVETKSPGKELRLLQKKRRKTLEALGCKVYRIRTLQEVDDYIKECMT